MMTRHEANAIISQAIEQAMQLNGGTISREWAVQKIIEMHIGEVTSDTFAHFAFLDWVPEAVRQFCNRMPKDGLRPMPQQMRLDFPNLKPWYPIERDGVLIAVQTWDATDAELLAKAENFEAQARTLTEEAQDLRRYVASRRQ